MFHLPVACIGKMPHIPYILDLSPNPYPSRSNPNPSDIYGLLVACRGRRGFKDGPHAFRPLVAPAGMLSGILGSFTTYVIIWMPNTRRGLSSIWPSIFSPPLGPYTSLLSVFSSALSPISGCHLLPLFYLLRSWDLNRTPQMMQRLGFSQKMLS